VSTQRLFISAIVGWSFAVLSALGARTAFINSSPSVVESVGWVFLGCAPVAIALVILRGRSTGTIAQVLYEAEQTGDASRRKRVETRG